MTENVLRVAGISKRFGGLQALSDVGMTIERGQVYGLIGPNGAGKTTFFNVITGLYTPDSGTFELAGKTYVPSAVHEVAKAGIARTFQNIRLFAEMTALENVMVGRHIRTHSGLFGAIFRTPSFKAEEQAIAARAHELLEYVGIGKYADFKARTLSYGDQRRLEIARALATDPQLIALDEPAAGMNSTEKTHAAPADRPDPQGRPHHPADRTRREAGDGPVRPRHGAGLRQADRRGHAGRRAARREGDRGLSGQEPYAHRQDGDRGSSVMSATLLKVSGLKVAYGGIEAVKGVSFEVREGELVTLIGSNGAGKTTTMKAITALLPLNDGDIEYLGQSIRGRGAWDLVKQGLAMVPEGRGVFTRMSIEENLQMGAHIRTDKADVAADLDKVFTIFPRLKERRDQLAGTLSGGEQQMLAIGRGLMSRPKVLLMDEPSMGLSPILVDKIFEIVREVSDQGVTILLVEQNASRALQIADRGYVMESGLITMAGDARADR